MTGRLIELIVIVLQLQSYKNGTFTLVLTALYNAIN